MCFGVSHARLSPLLMISSSFTSESMPTTGTLILTAGRTLAPSIIVDETGEYFKASALEASITP